MFLSHNAIAVRFIYAIVILSAHLSITFVRFLGCLADGELHRSSFLLSKDHSEIRIYSFLRGPKKTLMTA